MNYHELIEESKKWGKWHVQSVLPNTPEACITVMHDSNTGNDEPVVEICWPNEEFSVALAEWIVKLNNEAATAIETLAARVAELEAAQTPRPIEDAPRRLDQSEVTEEGFYWRYPGIPVRVFKRKRGSRKGELWFDGFGMVGMVNNPCNKGIWFVGPINPPAPTEVTK